MSNTNALTREQKIDLIIQLSRKPRPAIVEKWQLGGSNGKFYSAAGFPHGVSYTGEKRLAGYVLRSTDGTTFGTLLPTREAQEEKLQARDERAAQDWHTLLDNAPMKDIDRQLAFWQEEAARAARLAGKGS